MDETTSSWLTLLQTRSAGEEVPGTFVIDAAQNTGISRTGALYIIPDNSEQVYAAIFITQQSSYCTLDIGSFLIPYDGSTVFCHVTTEYGVVASVPEADADWLSATVLPAGDGAYRVAITAEPNHDGESRISSVELTSTDGALSLASIRIRQNGRNLDLEYAMVFIVNPNYTNDFTAYLPIDIYSEHDCFVDWGDGTGDRYLDDRDYYNPVPEEQRIPRHKYEGLEVGRSFEVVVTGTVTSLCSDWIPSAFRSSVTEVKHWGKTGLKRMDRAFNGFTGLTTLNLDETGAFEQVESFDGTFQDCPRLTAISGHLFDHAGKARSFDHTFCNCSGLSLLPESLFSNATAAESFTSTFDACRSLTGIPEKLFAQCPSARYFMGAFDGCESLRSIPESLFRSNKEAESFAYTFSRCRSLTSVPERLFETNTEVTDIESLFQECSNLETIPAGLFDSQRKILNCTQTFWSCVRLQSESPWTLIDGKKVHFYERQYYPDHFFYPWRHDCCFTDCWLLQDIESLPEGWR